MKFHSAFVDEVAHEVQQLGLRQCPVCASTESLYINTLPSVMSVGGFALNDQDDREAEPEASLALLITVTCSTCGHVLFFDSSKFRTGTDRLLYTGPDEDDQQSIWPPV